LIGIACPCSALIDLSPTLETVIRLLPMGQDFGSAALPTRLAAFKEGGDAFGLVLRAEQGGEGLAL
jgi:hypothetical protein